MCSVNFCPTRSVVRAIWGVVIAAIGLSSPVSQAGDTQPAALREALRARDAIKTARFDYVERFLQGKEPHNRFATWRGAGSDYIQIDHGDERGIVSKVRGRPDEPVRQPDFSLVTDGQSWRRNEAAADVRVVPWEDWSLPDFRTLGIDPTGTTDLQFDKRVAKSGGTIDYREEQEGGLWRVTADESSGAQFVWWIDPERGWNVVRTRSSVNGEIWYEQRISVKNMEGVWFPERVQRFSGRAENGELIQELQVLRAEINRPEHPQRFTPNDIGLESGMVIIERKAGLLDVWDGEKRMGQVEYYNKVYAGEIQPGPTVVRTGKRAEIMAELAELNRDATGTGESAPAALPTATVPAATQPVAPLELAEWEAYTLSFIRRHELDAGQAERALAILRDCQDGARALVLRRAALAAPSYGPDARSARDRAHAAEQRTVIEQRLESIFRKELVPRLDATLTSRQRERAGQEPENSTKPRTP